MTSESAAILDHIVILVPHSTLLNPPLWLTDAFAISPGSRHANGVTENKLILFSDGVYLELVAFIPGKEAERAHHRWGERREGTIIDWANTLHTEEELSIIRERVNSFKIGWEYEKAVEGGRTRPDGTELKWITSVWTLDGQLPDTRSFMGGELPFWCVDRTPRDLRIPYKTAPEATNHPSGAVGVAGVTVFVADGYTAWGMMYTYDAIQGVHGGKLHDQYSWQWPLRVPDGGSVVESSKVCLIWSEKEEIVTEKGRIELSLRSKSTTGIIGGRLGDGLPCLEIDFVS